MSEIDNSHLQVRTTLVASFSGRLKPYLVSESIKIKWLKITIEHIKNFKHLRKTERKKVQKSNVKKPQSLLGLEVLGRQLEGRRNLLKYNYLHFPDDSVWQHPKLNESETFSDTKFLPYWIRYFFWYQICSLPNPKLYKKTEKVLKPRSFQIETSHSAWWSS